MIWYSTLGFVLIFIITAASGNQSVAPGLPLPLNAILVGIRTYCSLSNDWTALISHLSLKIILVQYRDL